MPRQKSSWKTFDPGGLCFPPAGTAMGGVRRGLGLTTGRVKRLKILLFPFLRATECRPGPHNTGPPAGG